jgi:hypothetical protein
MRTLYITLFCIALTNRLFATDERVGASYRFIGQATVFNAFFSDNCLAADCEKKLECFELSQVGQYVDFVKEVEVEEKSYIIFKYWNYSDTDLKTKYNNPPNKDITFTPGGASLGSINYFAMLEDDFEDNTVKVPGKFQFSAITVPIKLRLKPFDFEDNINIGGAVIFQPRKLLGLKLRSTDLQNGLSFAAGLSLTNVKLDSTNTDNEIIGSTISRAFSGYGGLIFTKDNVNFSLLCGADWVRASEVKNWSNQGDLWIGIGFGLQLSSLTSLGKDSSGNGN